MKMISRIVKMKNTYDENENEAFYQFDQTFLITDHFFFQEIDEWDYNYPSKIDIIFMSKMLNIKKMDHDIIEYRHSKDCTKKLKSGKSCNCFEIVA